MEGSRARWIRGRGVDTAVALAWVPFSLLAARLDSHPAALNTLLAGVFLLSFSHQPLTMALVYGDPDNFRLRRAIFTWSPLVFLVAIMIGLHLALPLLAVVAGLWNAEHTLMQRYGLTRIYGRKSGDDRGLLERCMLISWLALALVWVAADSRTPGALAKLDLGQVNHDGVQTLHSLHTPALILLVPAALAAVFLLVKWIRAERRDTASNPAKHLYVGSTAALFVVMLINPVAGFIGYVAAHAIEYFVIVHHALGTRYLPGGGGTLGRSVRTVGRPAFFAIYVGGLLALMAVLRSFGMPNLYSVIFYGFGGLHVFYDGFIWKLRRPQVARSLVAA